MPSTAPWTPAQQRPYAWYDAELSQPRNVGYVQLAGSTSDAVVCPDLPAHTSMTDLELVIRCALTDWTPATQQSLITKHASGSTVAYAWEVSSSGAFLFRVSTDGVTLSNNFSTVAPAFVDGSAYWVKVTRRASDGRIQFFTAADQTEEPVAWTQLGANVTGITTAIFDSTAALSVGATNGALSAPTTGKIYRAIVRNGIDGTPVADFDARLCYAAGYADRYGNAWSLTTPKLYDISGNNRPAVTFAAGSNAPQHIPFDAPVVSIPPGSNGIVSTSNSAFNGATQLDLRLACVGRSAVNGVLMSTATSGLQGFRWTTTGAGTDSYFDIGDGTVARYTPYFLSGNVFTLNVLQIRRLTWDSATGAVNVYVKATTPAAAFTDMQSNVGWGTAVATGTHATGASIPAPNVGAGIGCYAGALSAHDLVVYGAQMATAINGTPTVVFNPALCTQTGYTDATGTAGLPFTVARQTAGRKPAVLSLAAKSNEAVCSLGTDDDMTIPAAAIPSMNGSSSWSNVLVGRQWGTPTSNGRYLSLRQSNIGPDLLFSNSPDRSLVQFYDGATVTNLALVPATLGLRSVFALTCAGLSASFSINAGTPATATVGNAAWPSGHTGNIGRYTGGSTWQDFEFQSLVMFDRALTAAEIAQVNRFYDGGL